MSPHALRLTGITKTYGANTVLRGVDMTVEPGEIHALLGENGAGKSTLIKLLAGVEPRDAGEISVGGTMLPAGHDPQDVRRNGVAFVHQNLALADSLSVADNIGLTVGFPRGRVGIDQAATRRRAERFLEVAGGTGIDPDAPAGSLTQDEKVLVALARAFALDARVVVLDEVGASLPTPEMERLAAGLRRAKGRGIAYVYVTHRLNEVFDFADRLTVLRDGRVVLSAPVAEVERTEVVEAIVGTAAASETTRHRSSPLAEVAVEVRDLTAAGVLEPAFFDIGRGEVLGVCGLVGSGIRSLARILGGAERPRTGEVRLDGAPLSLGRPAAMRAAGCAYVAGQRAREGIMPNLTVRENLFPLRARRAAFTPMGRLRKTDEVRRATALAEELQVRPAGEVEKAMRELSGGNQQKVVLGRALANHPRLLVLEDPTAGVDIGSRRVLHDLVRASAASGTAVLLVSTDYDEIASEADRVLVMRDGRVVGEVGGDRITADHLARLSHGSTRTLATEEGSS